MELSKYLPWPADNPGPWAGAWPASVGFRDCTRYNVENNPDYYCTHLILRGRLHLQTGNGVDVMLGKDDIFSMWPGIACSFYAAPPYAGDEVEMDWVRVGGPMAADLSRAMGTTEARPWNHAADPKRARELIRNLHVLTAEYPPQADLLAVATLHQIAAACAHERPVPTGDRPLALRIRDAMHQHVASGMNITDYAQAFKIARSHFFTLFKETFGKSPIEVLTEIRMDRAKDLLKNTDLSMKEVAFASGYSDPLYFSRLFRRRTGMPPSKFRTS
jgi:AraC-like DNA-binding protein